MLHFVITTSQTIFPNLPPTTYQQIIVASDADLSAKIQALKLSNLGVLASQDFLVGFNPRKYPLMELNLQEIFESCQNDPTQGQETTKTQQLNLNVLLNFCQSVMMNFSSISPSSFSDDQEFVNWL